MRAYGIRLSYPVALQAEMLSMLAKYIPGGVWTPAARVVALRRYGVRDTPVVLATILLEAGLSALAGVGVFVVGLALIGGADAPLLPLVAFAVLIAVLLYPPVFARAARRLLRPFGAEDVAAAAGADGVRAARVLRATWPLGGARALLPPAVGRGRPGADRDSVPRRGERGRRDRRRARGLRAVRARRSRGIGVRAAPRDRLRGSRARRDRSSTGSRSRSSRQGSCSSASCPAPAAAPRASRRRRCRGGRDASRARAR